MQTLLALCGAGTGGFSGALIGLMAIWADPIPPIGYTGDIMRAGMITGSIGGGAGAIVALNKDCSGDGKRHREW